MKNSIRKAIWGMGVLLFLCGCGSKADKTEYKDIAGTQEIIFIRVGNFFYPIKEIIETTCKSMDQEIALLANGGGTGSIGGKMPGESGSRPEPSQGAGESSGGEQTPSQGEPFQGNQEPSQGTAEPSQGEPSQGAASAVPDTGASGQEGLQNLPRELVDCINAKRVEQGLTSLSINEGLSGGAVIRSQEAASSFSHTRPDGSKFYTVNEEAMAECLARAGTGTGAEEIVESLITSDGGHREYIMDASMTMVGIGIYEKDGKITICMLFS